MIIITYICDSCGKQMERHEESGNKIGDYERQGDLMVQISTQTFYCQKCADDGEKEANFGMNFCI